MCDASMFEFKDRTSLTVVLMASVTLRPDMRFLLACEQGRRLADWGAESEPVQIYCVPGICSETAATTKTRGMKEARRELPRFLVRQDAGEMPRFRAGTELE